MSQTTKERIKRMSSGKLAVRFVEIDTTIADDHYLGEVFNPEIVIVSQEQLQAAVDSRISICRKYKYLLKILTVYYVGKSYEFSLHLKDSDRYYENPSEVIKTIRRVVKAGILDSDDPKKKEAKKLAIALGFT